MPRALLTAPVAAALAAAALPAAAPAAAVAQDCCGACGVDACLCPPPLAPSVGFTAPAFGPTCAAPAYGPACAAPAVPRLYQDGPRRLSGLPAYRPFGMPMLSEVGGCLGRGLGALADDVLLGPPVCGPGLPARLAAGPVGCAAPRLSVRPLTAFPPTCAAPAPVCAAPVCPPPVCAAPVCPPPVCPPVETCETEMVPCVQTRLARRRCVTWKDVEEVRYTTKRCEYLQPVTETHCRTVDRGCYKLVWVPNLVTENYTTTKHVRRVSVTRVPYTVTRKVAETCEQLVPYKHTTYVPRPVRRVFRPPTPTCAAPVVPGCAAPADAYYGGGFGAAADAGPAYPGPVFGDAVTTDAPQYSPAPMPAASPAVPGIEYAAPPATYAPQPTFAPSSPTFAPLPAPGGAGSPMIYEGGVIEGGVIDGGVIDGDAAPPIPRDDFDGDFSGTPTWSPVPNRAAKATGWVEETAPRKTW